jgi:hypothetical protein
MRGVLLYKLGYACLVVWFLVVPTTALAKGPGLEYTVLDGPGIGEPIRLEERYPHQLDEAVLTTVFGSRHDADVGRSQPERGGLGPRNELRFHMTFGKPVVIDLYPHAEGGPVAYASPGQAVVVPSGYSGRNAEFDVHPGWYDYRPGLVALLQEKGLPREDETQARTVPGGRLWALGASATGIALLAALLFGASPLTSDGRGAKGPQGAGPRARSSSIVANFGE